MRYSVKYTRNSSKEAELIGEDFPTLDASKAAAREHSPTPIKWTDVLGHRSVGFADHGQYEAAKMEHGVAVTDMPPYMKR